MNYIPTEAMDSNAFSIAINNARCSFNNYMLACEKLAALCRSPIEQQLVMALYGRTESEWHWCHSQYSLGKEPPFSDIFVYLQAKVGRYITDILIVDAREFPNITNIVIECDGHDFHERTKEQARRDRRRDRWMAAQSIKVFRFTGSEIYADADNCAEEIISAVYP